MQIVLCSAGHGQKMVIKIVASAESGVVVAGLKSFTGLHSTISFYGMLESQS